MSNELDDFILQLADVPDREPVLSELRVLQSIYGDDSIHVWNSSSHGEPHGGVIAISHDETVRYEVQVSLPPPYDEQDTSIRIMVSLPANYPEKSPPQLQLLSRYIGAFSVDSELFGAALKTFISSNGVEWSPETVCVFDGMEHVRELCARWYEQHLSEEKANELVREDEKERRDNIKDSHQPTSQSPTAEPERVVATIPAGVELVEAEPIIDRKSVFIGRACRIKDPAEVPVILNYLMSDRRIARAAHPIINAWRCTVQNILHQDNDDDGETAAGGRLAHLLQILDVDNVLVIVTRYFGGIHLGPDRFKHINQAARNALENGGLLDELSDDRKRTGRSKKKS